jgi:KaiC/GvpD/RAD55 family RecA-like ATPase
MQQNYVPIIRSVVIVNEGAEALKQLTLNITFDPVFAKAYTYALDEIPAGESVEITPVSVSLLTAYLFGLTEKIMGTMTFSIYREDQCLLEQDHTIELLAFDQWSGLLLMPEIIAAFVTPNHPQIAGILKVASSILSEWGVQDAFTGYQTQNPNAVKMQMAAIYAALQKEKITYMNPPASYEATGQRIRLPHVVLMQKQGTCLDLTVLYCACMEATGLHPLILFKKGHAFAGCWLEEETFADCMVDDVSAFEKRIVAGTEEILLVESTDLVSGDARPFDLAIKHGKDQLNDLRAFECAIDIRRSRGSGIRPIPLKLEQDYRETGVQSGEQQTMVQQEASPKAPAELDHSLLGRVAPETPLKMTKQKVWERKLLDFSLRNTLLNFRVTKNAIQLMTADLDELENHLSDGKDFRILEVPAEWSITMRDAKIFEIENEQDLVKSIATSEFKSYRIRTFLDEEALDKSLKNIYRSAKMSMEENGTNTLFLALGFLRWFESDVSEKARYAPLVLVPVDIVRSMRHKGYVIRSRQEEVQVNITLLEYLKQDHNVAILGLDPLPEDEHGIDLPLIFNTIRQGIMAKKRWNIENMAFVGLFSFGQFVMWNDIRNRSDAVAQNKVVASLIEGGMNWQPVANGIAAEQLDDVIAINEMAIPLSADSSQMVAITAAAAGESFVLHGPPGTGKSQTITNMIANALYQGKSVLFVAEKMAALNVVQKRLSDIGLAPFCLELHSNKTNKTAVLSALDRALEVGRVKPPEIYEETAAKIHALRHKLNAVVDALHESRDYGYTLYEAIKYYEANISEKGSVDFLAVQSPAFDRETLQEWQEYIRQYGIAIDAIGCYETHPLCGVEELHYSMAFGARFEKALDERIEDYLRVRASLDTVFKWAGDVADKTRTTLNGILELVRIAREPSTTLESLLKTPNFTGNVNRLNQLAENGETYRQITEAVSEQFDISVFNYSVEQAKMMWQQASQSWFLPKFLRQRKLIKTFRLYAKAPSAVTKENISTYYDQLIQRLTLQKAIDTAMPELTSLMSGLFMGVSTDWAEVKAAIAKAARLYDVFEKLSYLKSDSLIEAVKRAKVTPSVDECEAVVTQYIDAVDQLYHAFSIDVQLDAASPDWLASVHQRLSLYRTHIDQLRDKILFNQVDAQLCEKGLDAVSNAYRAGKLTSERLLSAYQCNLNYALILMTIQYDQRLEDFHGRHYDDLIEQYKESIALYQQLTVQELVAKLSAKVPVSGVNSAATSEMGILKKAIRNNGRMMSLRRLFDQIPLLLRKLSPCMLMSPISVAQYIDPSFPKFDLVIFDEASQLPTSEAVGTIARGDNVVIVGDPKQLPPTNFFSSNRIDEDNPEHEDLESLLDDCLAISMPQKSLKWHYRSRHESLIAYSNMKYYDNKLFTFPSPRDLVSEVKMIPVEGYYDKGKTRQNRAEADAIVAEIIRRMQDETLRYESVGVVTFSAVQQHLIDDLLYEAFKEYPELEAFDQSVNEPIFVKNLENVQGDERDVILFSVGYGPDVEGRVSMNFGPLNRDGGWRRLNVAISRARKAMIVYSVLKSDQIDLARTRSEGVVGLKGFLAFAERGKNILAQRAGTLIKADALVDTIAAAIGTLGYEVKCNIGCSEFKMDIGIVHPQDSETYILGLLLDGDHCKDAATARDRFVLQPSVLMGLGWSIYRIWTLDWLYDSARLLKEIKAAIEKALVKGETVLRKIEKKPLEKLVYERLEPMQDEYKASIAYTAAPIEVQGTSETFYLPESQYKIRTVARKIIELEAPISRKLLMKKVLGAWSISRGGSRVESIFSEVVDKMEHPTTRDEDRIFYWKVGQTPAQYAIYRVSDENGDKRSLEDIASAEILNAVTEVLLEQVSLSEVDLTRETAKKFGYARMGSLIEMSVAYAVSTGLRDGKLVKLENGNIAQPD